MSENSNIPPTTVSLREALGGVPDPDFTLVLPPGWVRRAVDEAEEQRMDAAMRQRLMQAHRPDLYARMRHLLKDAFQQMKSVSTVAMFIPGDDADESAYLPASLTATIIHAEPGKNLDGFVRNAIVNDGATALFDDKRILRLTRESTQTLDGDTIALSTVAYITPVPGSQRRRALQLTAVIMRPPEYGPDDIGVTRIRTLFDLCASTLSWKPAERA